MIDFIKLTEEEISKKYESLPQEFREILASAQTSAVINSIAKSKGIVNEEKNIMLQQVVGLLIMGFVNYDEMKEVMLNEIGVRKELILPTAEEIRQKILLPIINLLQKTFGLKNAFLIYADIVNENNIVSMSFDDMRDIVLKREENRIQRIITIVTNKYNKLESDKKLATTNIISVKDKQQREQLRTALPENLQWLSRTLEIITAPIWNL